MDHPNSGTPCHNIAYLEKRLIIEPLTEEVIVVFAEQIIAHSRYAIRLREPDYPPTLYLPPTDVRYDFFDEGTLNTFCESKGVAYYYSLVVGHQVAQNAAWTYPEPNPPYGKLADYVGFDTHKVRLYIVTGKVTTPSACH